MRFLRSAIVVSLFPIVALAQEVTNTSYVTTTGEKVLCIESTVALEKREAWKLLTTEGLKKWIAPNNRISTHRIRS
jgi:hypothetical protein